MWRLRLFRNSSGLQRMPTSVASRFASAQGGQLLSLQQQTQPFALSRQPAAPSRRCPLTRLPRSAQICYHSTMAGDQGRDEPTEHIQYHWIGDVERLEMYEPGGYHPVEIGHVLHDRYLVVDKLGSGGYSTVWLAMDKMNKRLVALKVGIADSGLPRRESEILHHLSHDPRIPASTPASGPTTTDDLLRRGRFSVPMVLVGGVLVPAGIVVVPSIGRERMFAIS